MMLLAPLLVAALASRASVATPPRPPDTVEGRRLAAFLAAAEAGSEKATRSFIEENFAPQALCETPVAPRLARIHGLIRRLGPFELVRVLRPSPERVRALVISRKTGKRYRLALDVEEGASRGLLGVDLEEADEEEATDAPKSSDTQLASEVDGWVTALAGKEAFSGVVLLARRGEPFFTKAWGLADRGLSVVNRADTRFNIGSIGKAFTRAAVMDLVRGGRLKLDDTIARLLPGSKIPSSDRITVSQLLEMKSGLGDIFGPRYDSTPKSRLRTLSDFLPLFEHEPLRFEPGSGRAYSNAGYVMLGLVIEKASGKSYWDFVSEHVFGPAGMNETGPFGPDEAVANRAVGYTRREDGSWRSNVYALPGRPSSAGGVFSTAGDLLRFVRAIAAGSIVLSPDGRPAGALGIAGGTEGANAVVETEPDGLTVVVLANLDPPIAERVASRIHRWAPRAAATREERIVH